MYSVQSNEDEDENENVDDDGSSLSSILSLSLRVLVSTTYNVHHTLYKYNQTTPGRGEEHTLWMDIEPPGGNRGTE